MLIRRYHTLQKELENKQKKINDLKNNSDKKKMIKF